MAVGDTYVFPGFLTPVLIQISSKATDYFTHMLQQRWEAKINFVDLYPILLNKRVKMALDRSPDFLRLPSQFFFFFVAFKEEFTKKNYASTVQVAPIHQYHVFWQIKILRTILKRVTQKTIFYEIISKSNQ